MFYAPVTKFVEALTYIVGVVIDGRTYLTKKCSVFKLFKKFVGDHRIIRLFEHPRLRDSFKIIQLY